MGGRPCGRICAHSGISGIREQGLAPTTVRNRAVMYLWEAAPAAECWRGLRPLIIPQLI